MASGSPPKPWERAGAAGASTVTPTTGSTNASMSSSSSPALPAKPNSLNAVVNRTASNYSPYGQATGAYGSGFGASPYGGSGFSNYSSPYSSPYSRFGGMGGMGGMGGYGGYGGGMGGGMYGGGYGGGMYGGGMGGFPGQDQNSLTNSFNQSTQATFQIIEGVVGAFGGFAQMLDSTYMATRSSFFAMISVAEQFSTLRDTLGSILGIFALMRWLRTLVAKVTGRPPPADATSLTPSAFAAFQGFTSSSSATHLPDGTPAPARPSKKPLLFFALAAFGLPYLMGKLIHALAKMQEDRAGPQGTVMGPDGQLVAAAPLDPSQLDFCRCLYDYTPEVQPPQQQAGPSIELEVKKGDLVAVLARTDPLGQASEWWRCRSRDGRVGYLPSPYLEVVRRAGQAPEQASRQITEAGEAERASSLLAGKSSRVNTMTTVGSERSLGSADGQKVKVPVVSGKPGDISVESFQKSQFNS